MTGQRYGKLTVLYPTGERRFNSCCWLCQCDCGRTKTFSAIELRSGGMRSCGCLKKSDLTGRRYGKLTVLKKADDNTWLCQCDCGNKSVVGHEDLTHHRKNTCGHKKDFTGNRYGHLTVIKQVGGDDWLCRCDCGVEVTASITELIGRCVRSCGNPGHILPNEPDYTGVTVNGFIGVSKVSNGRWLWKCGYCGKISDIIVSDVKKGNKCTCKITVEDKTPDYTDKKYGQLTGVRQVGRGRWLWKCDCGALNVYKVDDVISGKKRSCFGRRKHQ